MGDRGSIGDANPQIRIKAISEMVARRGLGRFVAARGRRQNKSLPPNGVWTAQTVVNMRYRSSQ